MAKKINSGMTKKQKISLHAAVDEIIEQSPETATAILTILATRTQTDEAVVVKGTKNRKGGKKKTAKAKDEIDLEELEDLDDEDEDEDLDEDDEDEDDDLDEDDEDEDDDEDEVEFELPKVKKLTEDSFWSTLESITEDAPHHDEADGGIRELSSAINAFGLDAKSMMEGSSRKERTESLKQGYSALLYTRDAIAKIEKAKLLKAIQAFDVKPGSKKPVALATQWITLVIENSGE